MVASVKKDATMCQGGGCPPLKSKYLSLKKSVAPDASLLCKNHFCRFHLTTTNRGPVDQELLAHARFFSI